MTTWRRCCSDAPQVRTSLEGLATTTRLKLGAGEVRRHDQGDPFRSLGMHTEEKKGGEPTVLGSHATTRRKTLEAQSCPVSCQASQDSREVLGRRTCSGKVLLAGIPQSMSTLPTYAQHTHTFNDINAFQCTISRAQFYHNATMKVPGLPRHTGRPKLVSGRHTGSLRLRTLIVGNTPRPR